MNIRFMFDNHTFAQAPTQEKARELFARDGCGSLFARDSRGQTLRPALHGRRRDDGTYGVSDDDLTQFYASVEEPAAKVADEARKALATNRSGAVQAPAVGPDLLQSLIDIGTGKLRHLQMGECPDHVEGHETRDPDCPACQALVKAASNVPVQGSQP